MLPQFDLLTPQTLSEALAMLAQHAPDVVPLAGGTGLLVDMRAGARQPSVLLDLGHLEELRAIRREDGRIVVGAGVTVSELLDSPLAEEHAPLLRQAAAVFANPLIRNRATVGGNLAYASPAADTAPPLLVLDAELELVSETGSRWVALRDFVTGVRKTVRKPDELLTTIRWPILPARAVGSYRKLALRKADAISVVSVAVLVILQDDGCCQEARIGLGAVAPTPIRASHAEDALRGRRLTRKLLAEAAHLAGEATCCITDIRGSDQHRRRVTEAWVRRLLSQSVGIAAD